MIISNLSIITKFSNFIQTFSFQHRYVYLYKWYEWMWFIKKNFILLIILLFINYLKIVVVGFNYIAVSKWWAYKIRSLLYRRKKILKTLNYSSGRHFLSEYMYLINQQHYFVRQKVMKKKIN